jgi:hypothetical protein
VDSILLGQDAASLERNPHISAVEKSNLARPHYVLRQNSCIILISYYRGGQKWVYSCEYAKHRVYSCIIIYLLLCYLFVLFVLLLLLLLLIKLL